MTDSNDVAPSDPSGDDEGRESEVKGWLHGALDREEQPKVDVLEGVQRKIRERSGGKFYADLWSTAKQPPTSTFLVTALVMLAVVVITYAILAPLRGKPEVVPTRPEPVQIVAPSAPRP
jgi:hypothetical protein